MREILFRGKCISYDNDLNGKWIYGQLVIRTDHDDGDDKYFICESGHQFIRCRSKMPCTYKVDPETVGQYIGLKDNAGRKIFEGDIVRYYSDIKDMFVGSPGVVRYGEFNCSCCNGVYGWYVEDGDIRDILDNRIIGNIHDNPELLEAER